MRYASYEGICQKINIEKKSSSETIAEDMLSMNLKIFLPEKHRECEVSMPEIEI